MIHHGADQIHRLDNKSIHFLHRFSGFIEHFLHIAENENQINERNAKKNCEECDGNGENDIESGLGIGHKRNAKIKMTMQNVKIKLHQVYLIVTFFSKSHLRLSGLPARGFLSSPGPPKIQTLAVCLS